MGHLHNWNGRAGGVFLIACDGYCSNCDLNGYNRGITANKTICEWIQNIDRLVLYKHRTDVCEMPKEVTFIADAKGKWIGDDPLLKVDLKKEPLIKEDKSEKYKKRAKKAWETRKKNKVI